MPHTGPLLKECPLDVPDSNVASYVDSFLREAPWLRRRVETVSFIDVDTVVRKTTLDVGMAEVKISASACPLFEDRPLVPLVLLKKELLVDFDLRDRQGAALAVVPREIDSFFAWSLLCVEARRVLGQDLTTQSMVVSDHLRSLAFNFPRPGDEAYDNTLHSWEIPGSWSDSDRRAWRTLLQDELFARLLRDFTFNFILMTQLEATSAIQLVKFSYQQYLPYSELLWSERLGIKPTELAIVAPSVGWVRSYHLRVEAPQDLRVTDVGLFRIQRDSSTSPLPAESYEVRVSAEAAQIHTTSSIRPADHVVAITMRVPLFGYLRAVWLTSLATAAILLVARILIDDVEAAMAERADAAVALLLVGPSLLAAYLVRPGEHAIASRLLRPIRYAVSGGGCLSYISAAVLVLGVQGDKLRLVWTCIATLAAIIAAAITIVVILTKREFDEASLSAAATDRRTIVVVPFRSS